EEEIEILVKLGIMEYEDSVFAPLIHRLLNRRVHIVFSELLGGTLCSGGCGLTRRLITSEEEFPRPLDVLVGILEERLFRARSPIHRTVGLNLLARSQTHGALVAELALGR